MGKTFQDRRRINEDSSSFKKDKKKNKWERSNKLLILNSEDYAQRSENNNREM